MSVLTHVEMGCSITVTTAFIDKAVVEYAIMAVMIVVLSCFGSLNSTIMTGSRGILSASRE